MMRGMDDASPWQATPLHGAYYLQIAEVSDLHHTYGWLNRCDLTANTEALILAAQEQVLPLGNDKHRSTKLGLILDVDCARTSLKSSNI